MEFLTLSNGTQMPLLGYGVYQITRDECERCVLDALSVGYRHLDTAQAYFNEEQVGSAIEKSGIPRGEIFLTTKVWLEHYGEAAARQSVEDSLRRLGTAYLDLVLLHQPFGDIYGAWRALERLYQEGKIRALGVSNFYPDRLVEFVNFTRVPPMVNQVEIHPYNQQTEALKWMAKYKVAPEAWGPFAEGRDGIFEDPLLREIGDKYHKSTAQIMLRWNLQRGIIVIPKSTHIARMRENFAVFDFSLSTEDMERIASLDRTRSSFFSHRDPATVEWFVKLIEERRNRK